MTDQEREALAADCESAGMNAFYQCKGSFSQSLGAAIRAALAAVLPLAVKAERERCIAIAQAEHGDAAQDIDMATRGGHETGRLQSEGAAHAAARIAAAIRQEPGHE